MRMIWTKTEGRRNTACEILKTAVKESMESFFPVNFYIFGEHYLIDHCEEFACDKFTLTKDGYLVGVVYINADNLPEEDSEERVTKAVNGAFLPLIIY